jgi:hypothetical protein
VSSVGIILIEIFAKIGKSFEIRKGSHTRTHEAEEKKMKVIMKMRRRTIEDKIKRKESVVFMSLRYSSDYCNATKIGTFLFTCVSITGRVLSPCFDSNVPKWNLCPSYTQITYRVLTYSVCHSD